MILCWKFFAERQKLTVVFFSLGKNAAHSKKPLMRFVYTSHENQQLLVNTKIDMQKFHDSDDPSVFEALM